MVDKIIVTDDIIDVYLKNGDKTRKNMNMSDQNNLCVTERGQYRTHRKDIFSKS